MNFFGLALANGVCGGIRTINGSSEKGVLPEMPHEMGCIT
jgi:hypothetical protein